jgi:hypothetical protein
MNQNYINLTNKIESAFISLIFIALLCIIPYVAWSQNPIVTENGLTGNPKSEWDISGAGDLSIQGFATDMSVNKGGTVHFKVSVTDAAMYAITIYRMGYYQGNGARAIASLGNFTGVAQPDPITDASGLIDCGNWSESASWAVPTNAVSGIYFAKLTKAGNSGSSHIFFVVRDDSRNPDILFKTSDATWQAYNIYGGKSLYTGTGGKASKVSYNRPFLTRNGGGGGGPSEDWVFNAEYPMVKWLERNGYDVSYTTDVDMDRGISVTPKAMLSVGHDEYWSAAERNRFETARNNGVHLAFFSGNEVYWKTRWENSIDGSNTNYRTLVCYKEGTMGENVCGNKCDPLANTWTGLWRDGCSFPSADGCNPENALTGQISWVGTSGAIQVPDTYKNLRFWRNTTVASLGSGQTATLSDNTLGYEWDAASNNGKYPLGRIKLSSTTLGEIHNLSLYRHSSGAWVFGAGTVQWSWGLDSDHDRGISTEDPRMQQATVNLFRDMGVTPETVQSGFTVNSPTDITLPTSIISTPSNASSLPINVALNVTGTASDVTGVVAGVEVSFDGGITWQVATGTTNWSYSWTPTTLGAATIKSRAFDDNGNMEAAGTAPSVNAVNVTVTNPPIVCPCSIFQPSNTPANVNGNDNQAIEVGTKFRSPINGYITGILFYKATNDNGTHIGHLWSSTGTSLASITFSGESASGWQQASLSSPVAINANTTYIVSYHSSANYYSFTDNYFTTAVTNGYLSALADGEDGANGLYRYTATPAFPNQTFQKSNYWVDVVFETTSGPDVTPPTVSSVAPISGGIGINPNAVVRATFSESIDPVTIGTATFELRNASNQLVFATVSYNAGTRTATLTPSISLAYSSSYTAILRGSLTNPRITDIAGNALAADYTWSFNTSSAPVSIPSDGPGGPILVIGNASNPFSRYASEILYAEGLNEFSVMDIGSVTASTLNNYDVVILGEMPLSAPQVIMLTNWTNSGGTLISFKPDALLYPLLGITASGGTLSDRYLLVNTSTGAGVGIVGETIQFHGEANQYTLNTATSLATLYSNATTPTSYAAITTKNVGSNGGKAIAFAYDLGKSIVYTRQGNPAWAGQERDGNTNIRPNDMFFPDWIDLNKVAIPQADEQQHLLANIILQGNLHRKPLPRFWFLPRKLKAAIVMTGDDHGSGGTVGRFNQYLGYGNNTANDILDWRAIRGTSYIYPNTPITDAQAAAFNAQGFEIGLHVNTNCSIYTQSSLQGFFNTQMQSFTSIFTSIPAPTTNRTHCISWSDWASKPKVEVENGIRLNTDYYYWPGTWVANRSGMFTGSGMPMRFADLDGSIIDNYQVTTQITDESGINSYTTFVSTLLDNAIGSSGYYGVFCANMHTDLSASAGSNDIISAAQARNIPVVTAKQMLTWLDGRNASSFGNINWSGSTLNFSVSAASGSYKMQGMLPTLASIGQLSSLTLNGSTISFTTEYIKGIEYAFFDATTGNYVATYNTSTIQPPIISNVIATPQANGTATITWQTDVLSNSRVDYGTNSSSLNLNSANGSMVTNHSITLTGLSAGVTYYFRVTSADASLSSTTEPTSPTPPLSITIPLPIVACASDATTIDFDAGTTGPNTLVVSDEGGGVILKPTINEDFSGTSLPSGWQSFSWSIGSGTSAVGGGSLSVDGARFNTVSPTPTFSSGTSMEFIATFGSVTFQNIGFGAGTDATGMGGIFNGEDSWAVFGTGNSTSILKARVKVGSNNSIDVDISGSYLNAPHLYRIEWKTNSFEFYIDGVLIHTQNTTITSSMRPAISDYAGDGAGILVDWMRVSPYATEGTFVSRIHDAGGMKNWGIASWNANVPVGTTLQLSQRQSNSNTTISSLPWIPIISNGATIGGTARYIQYKADFTTTNTAITPTLKDISFACENAVNFAPEIVNHPSTQALCAGPIVSFSSLANGTPSPTVQWQVSTDNGGNWTDLVGETNSTLTLTANAANNGKQFRTIWTNSIGSATSNPATLTVYAQPSGTITSASTVCTGDNVSLTFNATTGSSPYQLVINGATYPNITSGQTFPVNRTELSIWGNTGTPANPDANDSSNDNVLSIEVGTKFQSSQSGYINGIRFYKGSSNTGNHIAKLWTSTGTLLASAPFTAETASGWQEVRFTTPIAIQANTTYIASYFSQSGGFAITGGTFTNAITNGPLTALQSNAPNGANGVYLYGGGFPTNGSTSNYWVDVLFLKTNDAYQLTSILDNNGCAVTGTPLSSVTINPKPVGTIVATATPVCEGNALNLTLNTTVGNGPFSLTINGNPYTNVVSGTPFSVGAATFTPTPLSIWTPSTVGGAQTGANPDNAATDLGLKIRSSESGTISAIRFYKHGTDVLNFTGSLWAEGSTVTPLAMANYTSDNTAGWKQINFATPVPINANTTYIASYLSPNPNIYAYTGGGLSTPIVNAPLTALGSAYNQPPAGYPNTSSTANYWIDVVFTSASITTNYNLTEITSAIGCASSGNPISTAAVTVYSHPTGVITGTATRCSGEATTLSIAVTGTGPWSGTLSDGTSFSGSTSPLTVSVTPSTTTTYTIASLSGAYCAALPADLTGSAVVTINPLPTGVVSGSTTICSGGTTEVSVALTGTQPWNLTYTDGITSTPISNITTSPYVITVSTAGTYMLTALSDATTCEGTFSGSAAIGVRLAPDAPIASNQIVCEQAPIQTIIATATGGTITWYNAASNGTLVSNPTLNTVGSITYYAQASDGTCSSLTRTPVILTINAAPAAPTASNQTVCSNGSPTQTLTATATGGTIIWYNAASNGSIVPPTQVGVGISTYYAEASNGTCSSLTRTAVTLTINALPTASIAYSNIPYCINRGGTVSVIQTGQIGGTYASTSGLDINSLTGEIYLATSAAGSYSVTYTFTNGTCSNTATASATLRVCVEVEAKVFLSGPLNTNGTAMNNALETKNLLPLTSPFGTGETATIVTSATNDGIVDWVKLELRSSSTPTDIIATRSALLKTNGDIVDIDGISSVLLNAVPGTYHLAVRHRNHLSIMTEMAQTTNTAILIYNFVTSPTYGTNAQRMIGASKAMWGGDASGNNMLLYTGSGGGTNDRQTILIALAGNIQVLNTYNSADTNLDGNILNSGAGNDRQLILNNLAGLPFRIGQMPQ